LCWCYTSGACPTSRPWVSPPGCLLLTSFNVHIISRLNSETLAMGVRLSITHLGLCPLVVLHLNAQLCAWVALDPPVLS
jgi:hypothetical protein